ncbi:MAG: FAD-dependent oxidoreductase, partial [Hyphomonadaceae bacterium]
MKRRTVLTGIAAVGAMAGCSTLGPTARARLGETGWPSDEAWQDLSHAVSGRLNAVSVPVLDPAAAPSFYYGNPIWIGDQPALTQASGWVGAWTSAPSAYAIHAESAADVSAAVKFAARHRVRLVVKGGGHSYMGGSSAPDSLLVWTRGLQSIDVHDAFVPQGSTANPTPAVSVGAGCIWGRVYDAVTTKHGRYVQGGGCTTVGVAGLVQGGGFGSFSKGFGLAAASLLEAEIVTADGEIRVVNDTKEPELFWALRGGGGGTFGVVTRLTLKTHTLPAFVGAANLGVAAKTDEAFRTLVAR